jgi:hypothetical protein
MSFPITIDPNQTNKETPIAENFHALLAAGHFGLDLSRRSGLLLWFFGDGDAITDDDVTCTDDTTNYVVRALSGGAISVATGTTNWNDTATYGRIGRAVFADGVLTWHDHRLKTGGILRGDAAAADLNDDVTALSSSSGAVTIDCSAGDFFTFTLTENVTTISFSNLPGSGKGASKMVRITQDSTPRTVAWPASFRWAGGTDGVVSTGSGAVDLLAITTHDNGTTWLATLANAFAA